MLMWIFRILVVGALTLMIGGIQSFFGEAIWWLALLTAAALYYGESFLVKRAFMQLVLTPFKMKGAVLRGAEAVVHSVSPADPPAPRKSRVSGEAAPDAEAESAAEGESGDDADDDEGVDPDDLVAGHAYYLIDATITPRPSNGKFTHWEPGELVIVDENAPPEETDKSDDEDKGRIHRIELFEDGKFVRDQGMKVAGPFRLRIHAGMPPQILRGKFRYYFEDFGEIEFPPPGA